MSGVRFDWVESGVMIKLAGDETVSFRLNPSACHRNIPKEMNKMLNLCCTFTRSPSLCHDRCYWFLSRLQYNAGEYVHLVSTHSPATPYANSKLRSHRRVTEIILGFSFSDHPWPWDYYVVQHSRLYAYIRCGGLNNRK